MGRWINGVEWRKISSPSSSFTSFSLAVRITCDRLRCRVNETWEANTVDFSPRCRIWKKGACIPIQTHTYTHTHKTYTCTHAYAYKHKIPTHTHRHSFPHTHTHTSPPTHPRTHVFLCQLFLLCYIKVKRIHAHAHLYTDTHLYTGTHTHTPTHPVL